MRHRSETAAGIRVQMVDKNDSLLREVEDELRQDQLKKLWANYSKFVFGAAALFIGGVFIYQQLEHSRVAAAQEAGARYEVARRLQQDNKPTEFQALAQKGPAGYVTLARFQSAAASVKADKTADAVAAYDAIAADGAADPISRDFARMQAAALQLATADWTEMQNRLTPLVDERNAFRATARELLGLAARKAGKNDEARKLFIQVISDGKASQPLKDRVSGHMSALVAADLSKAATPVPATAAAPSTAPAPAAEPKK
jgi:hypothetical protein